MDQTIDILIPVQLPSWWKTVALERYAKHASPGTTVIGIDLTSEQQHELSDESLPRFLLDNARTQESDGVGAHIIDCFSDPGLALLSNALDRPVIGVGHAGLWYAYGQFERYAVITSEQPTADRILTNAEAWNLDSRLLGVAAIGVPAGDVPSNADEALEACVEKSCRFAEDADGLVLGCTELAEFAPRLGTRLRSAGFRLSVVNPIAVAIRLAELRTMLAAYGDMSGQEAH